MKKITLAALVAVAAGFTQANAAMNPGVQDALDSQNQNEMLDSLNMHWFNIGDKYSISDLITSLTNPASDTSGTTGYAWQQFGDMLNHSIALDNWEVASINALDDKTNAMSKELSAGIASVAALSSVAVSDVKKGEVSVGGGYGSYNSQSSVAFGGAVGITDNWSVNAGIGLANAGENTFRFGTNAKFKVF